MFNIVGAGVYSRRLQRALEAAKVLGDLLAALTRALRVAPGDNPGEVLAVALREGRTLVGAEMVVLRLPDSMVGRLEIRMPEDAAWPSARRLRQWQAEIAQRLCPIEVVLRPRGLATRDGMIFPIFAVGGTVGFVGAFSPSPAGISREQCAGLALLLQGALARAENLRLCGTTDVMTTAQMRARLAHEVHGGPLQMLMGIVLRLRLAREAAAEPSLETLRQLEAELVQVISQMRLLVRNLRVTPPEVDLEDRVRAALARLGRAKNLSWSLCWEVPEDGLPARTADEVLLVINEALANVYRHAAAKHVEIHGRIRGGALQVTIRDNGVGFDVAQVLRRSVRTLSFGLLSMQERMAALGGTLRLRSQPGRGTRVLISLSLNRRDKDEAR